MRVQAYVRVLKVGAAALAPVAFACQSSGGLIARGQAAQPSVPAARVLLESDRGLHRALRAVVRTPDELSSVWREAHVSFGSPPPPPSVDFTREMVIVVAAGPQGGPGTRITVASTADREGLLEVAIEVRQHPRAEILGGS